MLGISPGGSNAAKTAQDYVGESRWIDSFSPHVQMRYCTRMSDPQDGLEVLRAELAALRVRIDRLEQRAGVAPESAVKAPEAPPVIPIAPPSGSMLAPPATPPAAPAAFDRGAQQAAVPFPRKRESEALESKIGQLWLNRIGIFAILIGVS
jgi:uncharacterized membrane protein